MVEKKKRNNATITFSDRAQKEKLLLQLNSIQLQNLMPECARGKDCQMVIWAIGYLYNLAVRGKIRVQVPMFEEDSQEKYHLIDEIERLKKQLHCQDEMQLQIQRLKDRVRELEWLEESYVDTINRLKKR